MKAIDLRLIKIILILLSCGYSLNLTITDYHDPQANHILDAEIYENTLIISAMVQGIEFYDISNGGQLNHIDHFTLGQNGKRTAWKRLIITLILLQKMDYMLLTYPDPLILKI